MTKLEMITLIAKTLYTALDTDPEGVSPYVSAIKPDYSYVVIDGNVDLQAAASDIFDAITQALGTTEKPL